jgi:tetratricopeptide (TPR) repeat protein
MRINLFVLMISFLLPATGDFSSTVVLPDSSEMYELDRIFQSNQLNEAANMAAKLSQSLAHLPYERLSMLYLSIGILDSCAYYTKKTMDIVYNLDDFEGVTDIDKALERYSKKVKSAKKSQERGITEEAVREYNEILNIFPDFSVALYELGNIYYANQEFDKALNYTYKASRINTLNENYEIQVRNISKNFYKSAENQRKQKRYNEALDNYSKAVKYYPEFSDC